MIGLTDPAFVGSLIPAAALTDDANNVLTDDAGNILTYV